MKPNPPFRITIKPGGYPTAGPYTLQPSKPTWRRVPCHWRALDGSGRALTGWHLTPALALAAALRP